MTAAPSAESLRRTPLCDAHRRRGARMMEFGGWDMPVSFEGILAEHRAVRERVGIFDVSHMGEIELSGPHALEAGQHLVTNDLSRLGDGDSLYTVICQPDGGIVDDVIVTRFAADRFQLCVNASNEAKDLAWIEEHAGGATVTNRSAETALVAVQGPAAERLLGRLVPDGFGLAEQRPFTCRSGPVAGVPAAISRTGYTGEDGFELYLPWDRAEEIWEALLEKGRDDGVEPIGLGARDTLRLEAALPLYGNDIDETTTPLEAGIGWVVRFGKGDFVGREALEAQKRAGLRRRLVGIAMGDNSVPRHGYPVHVEGSAPGEVTSGTKGPTVGRGIALAYLPVGAAAPGTAASVEIRGKGHPAEVVERPFYRRRPTV